MIKNCLSVTVTVTDYGLRPDGGRSKERGRAHQPGQTYCTTHHRITRMLRECRINIVNSKLMYDKKI